MEILILNFLLYFFYFIFNRRNTGMLFKTLLFMFMFVTFSSIFIWESGIYGFIHYNYIFTWELSLTPFIYLFTIFVILFIPIKKFNENELESVILDDSFKIEAIGNFSIAYGISLLFILILFVDYNAALESASEVYKDSEHGELAMPEFIYKLYTLHKLLYPFILLLGFYYLSFKREQWMKTLLLLIAAILPKVFVSIVTVSRGSLFFLLIELLICFLLFKKFIPRNTKRILYIGSIAFLIILIPVAVIFTTSRFEETAYTPLMSVFKYFGESFLNFNCTFWGNVEEYPMGEFKFPFIYQIVDSPHTFLSRRERYSFFSDMTGTNVLLFKTIVGDFYLEYGALLGGLVLIILSRLYSRVIRFKKQIRFSTLILFFYYYELVFVGVFDLLWHAKTLLQMVLFTTVLYMFIRYKFQLAKIPNDFHSIGRL